MAFVIGVSGQAQMGKDTVADYLAKKLNAKAPDKFSIWERTAFANNVKKVYQETFDRDRDFIEEWKVKAENPPGFDMNVRKSLQFIGDGFREIYPTIWLDLVFRNISKPTIISDVRYVNEFLRVKKEGGLNILVGRPEKLNDDPNGSEAQIRPYVKWCLDHYGDNDVTMIGSEPDVPPNMDKFDLFINNNKDLETLYGNIDQLVLPFIEQFVFKFNIPE